MINTKDKSFRIGAGITLFMLFLILLGLFWTPYDPNAMNAAEKMAKPGMGHLLGTDNFGRDIFSRVVRPLLSLHRAFCGTYHRRSHRILRRLG